MLRPSIESHDFSRGSKSIQTATTKCHIAFIKNDSEIISPDSELKYTKLFMINIFGSGNRRVTLGEIINNNPKIYYQQVQTTGGIYFEFITFVF